MSVRKIALPGAVVQIAVATLLGLGMGMMMGWTVEAGIVFGLGRIDIHAPHCIAQAR